MAKKYLTLEEASLELGMAPDELVRMRERGEIRGFADRGTWKFKSEDVEEFGRSRQTDSSPEVPLLDDPKGGMTEVIRKGPGGRMNKTSDSDVRLLLDDTLVPGSEDSGPEVGLANIGNSDSDVRLIDDGAGMVDAGSDSDVKLINTAADETLAAPGLSLDDGSDSDVKLVAPGSDSDVRLAKPSGRGVPDHSDSDIRLAGTDDLATLDQTSMRKATKDKQDKTVHLSSRRKGNQPTPDDTVALTGGVSPDESSVVIGAVDSGIALDAGSGTKIGGGAAADSGITLQHLADSGISLEKVDSGITLAGPADSGIALDADSGIALEADSGITVERHEDSGISLADDSGIRLEDKKRGDRTARYA